MNNQVAAILELQDGKVSRLSWEALGAAQQLGQLCGLPVAAVLIGPEAAPFIAEVAAQRVASVVHVEGVAGRYTPDSYAAALAEVLPKLSASYVVFPHSYQVREFGPKVSAKLNSPFLGDCIAFRKDGNELVFSRQLYQGKLVADVVFDGPGPYSFSVQAGSFQAVQSADAGASCPVERVQVSAAAGGSRTRPLERLQEAARTVDLSESEIIVAVGRGIKEAENLPLVEKLAQVLGAQVAGSRPICDSGWLPMERQVGSSGQTVAPKLYFAVGISGAIQHLVGMKGSRKIVAINKDQNAPIFEVADIGIVANLFDVVPAITEEIARLRKS